MPIAPTYRLIYASHIAPVCQDDLKAALTRIVSRSIAANRKAKITGLLIAHKGWFVQALEGPRAAVDRLFDTIAADPRHHHALPISQGEIDGRLFEQWSMCARMLTANDEAVLSALNPKSAFDPTKIPDRTLMRLLATVADVHWRVLSEQQSLAA
ncbi:BLUF domain-containing protein [Phenylobacterium sp.]|uniref:BLUF domain-containing protein n=1 Tax=Phenylobacterium sp. TaxID=1871053 RepID=UPI002F423D10